MQDSLPCPREKNKSWYFTGVYVIKQYNTRYRFFQNFEDNNIPHNEILQTTGQKKNFSNRSLVEKNDARFSSYEVQVTKASWMNAFC